MRGILLKPNTSMYVRRGPQSLIHLHPEAPLTTPKPIQPLQRSPAPSSRPAGQPPAGVTKTRVAARRVPLPNPAFHAQWRQGPAAGPGVVANPPSQARQLTQRLQLCVFAPRRLPPRFAGIVLHCTSPRRAWQLLCVLPACTARRPLTPQDTASARPTSMKDFRREKPTFTGQVSPKQHCCLSLPPGHLAATALHARPRRRACPWPAEHTTCTPHGRRSWTAPASTLTSGRGPGTRLCSQ